MWSHGQHQCLTDHEVSGLIWSYHVSPDTWSWSPPAHVSSDLLHVPHVSHCRSLMMRLVELMMNVFVFLADDGLECGTVISTDSSVAQVDSVLRCQTSQHQHSLQHRQHQGATHWGHSTLTTVSVNHEIIDILNHQCLWVTRIVSADAAQHISSSLVFRQNTNNIRFSATGAQLLSHLQPVQSLTPLHQDLYQHVE